MGRFIGGIFGNTVPAAPTTGAGSAVWSQRDQYYLSSENRWILIAGMTATGGEATTTYTEPGGNSYKAHVWTSSGNLNVTALASGLPNAIEYVVVAGGGGGSNQHAGGGGAGGYRSSVSGENTGGPSPTIESTQDATVNTYPVTIGAGGAGSTPGGNGSAPAGSQGSTTTFALASPIASTGGGGSGNWNSYASSAGSGGSGGGSGSGKPTIYAGGEGTAGQGYDGGSIDATGCPTAPSMHAGGGGGGAGAAGGDAIADTPHPAPSSARVLTGQGGIGEKTLIMGPTNTAYGTPGPATGRYFAGGGTSAWYYTDGGDPQANPTPGGAGGGGGGIRGPAPTTAGEAATANTGGGGGSSVNWNYDGGAGGSGIVMCRYRIDPSEV